MQNFAGITDIRAYAYSPGPPSRGLHCGTAGGLDGNETACGPGLNDLLAFEAATLAAAAGLDGEGVAEAALQAREAIVPFRGAAVTTGWPKKEGGSEEGGGEEGDSQPKCAPSEWSGTYDYGNRWVVVIGCGGCGGGDDVGGGGGG